MGAEIKGPTLSDVARKAGVSYATADRVINKRGNVTEKSISKVRHTVTTLGYVRNVAAANLSRGRIYRLAFLIPKGPNAFFNRVRQHIEHAAERLHLERVRAEVFEVDAFAVEGLHDNIAALVREDLDGVAIVGLQSDVLAAPLANLRDKGVAVVGLVSDLPQEFRSDYIGIDNVVAGRTAARLIGMSHAGRQGRVQVLVGSLAARDHSERLSGFCEVIAADFPQIQILPPLMTRDSAKTVKQKVMHLLDAQAKLSALYNAGAGNSGLVEALRVAQPRRPFCVVHELVAHSRQALVDGYIDLVIDQRPDVEIDRAFAVLRALIDEQALPPMPDLVPTIYVQDNLPADTLTDLTMRQAT